MAPILPLAATLPIRCTEGGGGPLGEGGGGQRDPATAPAATTRCTRGGEGKGGGPPGERRPACQNY